MVRTLSTYPITYLNGVGLVATGKRAINMGNYYDDYYPCRKPQETHITVGDSYRTLSEMVARIKKDYREASKIANKLYSQDLRKFTKNIFDHIYQNFQYKPDPPGREQIKGVAGSYAMRKTGIDCDDMSFLIGTILYNKKIPFVIRKTARKASGDFSHVYIIVPKSQGLSTKKRKNYYVIDPVLDTYDFEYPANDVPRYYDEIFVNPKNITMNGVEECNCTINGIENYNLDTKEGWIKLQKNIIAGTEPVPTDDEHDEFINKINTLINAWDDPEKREYVIGVLLADEEAQSDDTLAGLDGFFKKVFKGVKKTTKKVGRGIKKATRAAGRTAKKGLKVFPLTLLSREGVKLWFRAAGRKKAKALWPGLYTEQQARAVGLDINDWNQRRKKWKKVDRIFENIGGDSNKIAKAIYDGARKIAGNKKWFLPYDIVWNKRTIFPSRVRGIKPSVPVKAPQSNSRAIGAYNRYSSLFNRYKIINPTLANKYAVVANKYASAAKRPIIKLTKGSPKISKILRPSIRPSKILKPFIKPRTKPRVNTAALSSYNRYKSYYDRAKTSNPTAANKYASLANRYASSAKKPILPAVLPKISSTRIRRIPTLRRRSVVPSRRRIGISRVMRRSLRGIEEMEMMTGLGEPVSAAAAIAAAAPVIASIVAVMKNIKEDPKSLLESEEVQKAVSQLKSKDTAKNLLSQLKSKKPLKELTSNVEDAFEQLKSGNLTEELKQQLPLEIQQAVKRNILQLPKATRPTELVAQPAATNQQVEELRTPPSPTPSPLPAPTPTAPPPPPEAEDNTIKYILIGSGVLLVGGTILYLASQGMNGTEENTVEI